VSNRTTKILLAPNGKPSNLNEEQYYLVRTPEFKSWFGDWERLAYAKVKDPAMDEVTLENLLKDVSKVVDENGEPLVVYRGMPKKRRVGNIFRYNVNLFGTKGIGGRQTNFFAFYFTDIKEVAEAYGENLSEEGGGGYIVKPYFLNSRNIFKAYTKKNEYELSFKKLYDIANNTGKPIYEKNSQGEIETDFKGNLKEWKDQAWEWKGQYEGYPELKQTFTYFVDWNKNQSNQWFWKNYLKTYLNYDGLVFYEISQNISFDKNDKWIPQFGDEFSKTYAVFDSNQIKLADGSNTTFDGSNPDIRFDDGGDIKRHKKDIMQKVKKGGITYGKSHAEGGIPVKNASTGDMLEVEGGEGIVNKRSMASDKMVKLNGKEMSICEAVSQLNQLEGGVQFDCDDVEDRQFLEEMALGGELERGIRTEKEHIQVLKDLYAKKITPNQATRRIAQDHLKEDKRYYTRLAKMEGKMADGGEIYDNGGEVEFIDYKDGLIMYEPTYKKYYANDVEFDTLEEAQKFLDSGEMSSDIQEAYRRGLFDDGGEIDGNEPLLVSNYILNRHPKKDDVFQGGKVNGYKIVKFKKLKKHYGIVYEILLLDTKANADGNFNKRIVGYTPQTKK